MWPMVPRPGAAHRISCAPSRTVVYRYCLTPSHVCLCLFVGASRKETKWRANGWSRIPAVPEGRRGETKQSASPPRRCSHPQARFAQTAPVFNNHARLFKRTFSGDGTPCRTPSPTMTPISVPRFWTSEGLTQAESSS